MAIKNLACIQQINHCLTRPSSTGTSAILHIVPMKNISTPTKNAGMQTAEPLSHRRQPAPRKSTIAFLRQFSRAYSCAPTLPVALGGFCAN